MLIIPILVVVFSRADRLDNSCWNNCKCYFMIVKDYNKNLLSFSITVDHGNALSPNQSIFILFIYFMKFIYPSYPAYCDCFAYNHIAYISHIYFILIILLLQYCQFMLWHRIYLLNIFIPRTHTLYTAKEKKPFLHE